jgi:SAM-dependent methyltransferase
MHPSAQNTKPKLSQLHDLGMGIRSEPQCDLENLLRSHEVLFKKKKVLDVACYTGVSTQFVKKSGADVVIGVDFSEEALKVATDNFSDPHIIYTCQDIENFEALSTLVKLVDVVISFGCLYHLNDLHNVLKSLAQPHIEYLLLDSLYGPETIHPDTFVRFEKRTDMDRDVIPKYVPNLSYFISQLDLLGFGMDYVEKYYTTVDFSKVKDYNANMRMTMRFFNKSKMPNKKGFVIDQVWQWSDDNLKQEI